MASGSSEGRPEAIGAIAHLARSENRISILELLTEGSYEPSELVERTGASRPTLGRILAEFEDRGWAGRTTDGYEATPAGDRVASEFRSLIGSMETIERLGDAVDWIPTDELHVGLHHFNDATLGPPGGDDPVESTDYVADLLRDASRWDGITHLVAPELKLDVMLEGVRSGRLESNLVLTTDLVEYLRSKPERREWLRAFVEAGANVYRYGRGIPCNLLVIDDLVLITESYPESGHPYTSISTENEAVRSWAGELIDRYRADAEAVEPDALSA